VLPAVLGVDVAWAGDVQGVGNIDGGAARVLEVHIHGCTVNASAGAPWQG
jgi:hypothetical protein